MSSFLKEIPVVFSFIDTVQSFIRTRQAVMRGENLHLLSDTQLRQQEFMRPWSFNVTESILVSLPFTASISFIDFLLQNSDGDLYAKIYSYVWPTSLPFLLLLIGLISGRMGLIKEDRTRSKVRLSTRAYLYIEGAYGFLPEMLMVLVVGYASLFGGISVIPYLALFI